MADNIFLDTPTANGEIIATDQIGTSSGPHYQFVKLVDGTLGSSAAIAGSTGGLAVTSTSIVIASGTVTATAATNPWSSAPGFNVPLVSASSGLVQVLTSGPFLLSSAGVSQLILPVSSTAGYAPVTSSAGLTVNISSGSVTSTGPTSLSSGTVTLSSNPTVIAASSGVTQVLTSGPFLLSSAGVSQLILPISSTAGYAQVTSSAGLMVNVSSGIITSTATTITSGTVTLSSAIAVSSGTITLSSATSLSSGTVTLSSAIGISSGTITATAGTNPWSSAPGFNVPIVSVSSGLIIALNRATVTTSGLTSYHKMSTGGAVIDNMTTAASNLMSYMIFNSTAAPQTVKIFNSTTTGTSVGTTTNLLLVLLTPGSTGGGGANFSFPHPGLYSSNGWSVAFTANMGDTDTGAPGTNTVSFHAAYQV